MMGTDAGVSSAGHRLITTFIRDETTDLKKSLTRASRFALFTCVVIFACWLAMFLVTSNVLSDNQETLRLLTLAGHRRRVANSIIISVRSLELVRVGFSTAADEATARNDLVDLSALFDRLERDLYEDSRVSSAARAFFYVPSITMQALVGSVLVDRVYNLKEAGQVFLAAAARASTLATNQFNIITDQSVFTILANGPTVYLTALYKAAEYYKSAVDENYVDVWSMEILIFGIAIIALGLFIAFILRPTVASVEKGSADILKLFLALPRPVVRLLQRRFLQALRNQGDDEEDDDEGAIAGTDKNNDYADDVSDADSSISAMSGDSDGMGGNIRMLSSPSQGGTTDTSSRPALDADPMSETRLASLNAMHRTTMRILAAKYAFLILYVLVYIIVIIIMSHTFFANNREMSNTIYGSANRQVYTSQMSYLTLESMLNPRVTPLAPYVVEDLPVATNPEAPAAYVSPRRTMQRGNVTGADLSSVLGPYKTLDELVAVFASPRSPLDYVTSRAVAGDILSAMYGSSFSAARGSGIAAEAAVLGDLRALTARIRARRVAGLSAPSAAATDGVATPRAEATDTARSVRVPSLLPSNIEGISYGIRDVFEEVKENPGNQYTEDAQMAYYNAVEVGRGLVYGDVNVDLNGDLSAQQTALLYSDACAIRNNLDASTFAMLDNVVGGATITAFDAGCKTFLGSVVTRGMSETNTIALVYTQQFAAFDRAGYMSSGYPYLTEPPYSTYDPARLNAGYTPPAVGSADYVSMLSSLSLMSQAVNTYLEVLNAISSNEYELAALRKQNDFDTFREVLLICFVVFLFLLHFLIFHPIFFKFNEGAQQTMSLLLIIPPDVVSKVQHIHSFVKSVHKKV